MFAATAICRADLKTQDAAALPRLELSGLPPKVRASLQTAYDAASAHPRDSVVVGRLAMMLHAYEQYRAAADCYAIVRRIDSASATWAYLSGVVQAELGDHGAAVDSFRRALQLDANYLPARLRLADGLMELGGLDASYEAYASLAKDLPQFALAQYGLGRVASLRGSPKEAVDRYERAVDLAPQFGPAHYALALLYRDLGQPDRAQSHLDAYRRYTVLRPNVRDPLLDQVRALRETARDVLADAARVAAAGRFEEAIALQLKALELDPRTAQAHVNLIALYGRTGRPDDARRHYEEALQLESGAADAHYNYGVLLAEARRDEEAQEAFRKALTVDPFHAPAHNNLAALLARARRYEEAAAHYRQALANDPQHHTARFNLGRVLVLLGKRAEAIDQFRQALDGAERRGDAAGTAAIRAELRKVTGKQ